MAVKRVPVAVERPDENLVSGVWGSEEDAVDDAEGDGLGVDVPGGGDGAGVALELGVRFEVEVGGEAEV